MSRPDEQLSGLDIAAAITDGIGEPGPARRAMFSGAAIAAAIRAERLAIGPYPLTFLAGCVRSLGLEGALRLPEPLIGEQRTVLAREWMSAAFAGSSPDVVRDEVFARWLGMVAVLLSARSTVTATTTSGQPGPGSGSESTE
ncbi:hypothetical protein ACFXO9_31030 [Nocardia tengchongensis]|uniref:hypothetical protein n=1 Tax=Nocardia tengchongensis TaxID=2055889 RepID=UPI00367D382E